MLHLLGHLRGAVLRCEVVEVSVVREAGLRGVTEGLTGLGALEDTRPLRGDQHNLLSSLRAPGHLLLELHDQLLVAGQEVPPGPGVADSVSRERHAVVEVTLGGDVLQWKSFDVAVRVTVGEYVNSLRNVEIISQMDH